MPTPDDFWSYFGALATYVGVLALPGGLIGLAAGLRGWALAGLAPLLSYTVTGLAGPWLAKVHVPYNALSVAGCTLLLAGVVFGLRRLAAARGWSAPGTAEPVTTWTRRAHLAVVACVLLALGLSIAAVVTAKSGTFPVFQRWDTVYHGNGIRYIADTGDGSLTGMGKLNWYPDGSFYPNGYHLVGALVYQLSGTTVPITMNAMIMPTAGLFALALVALVRQLGGRAVLAGCAALLAGTATTGAYEQVSSGLLPFALGIVLTPLAVVALQRYLVRPDIGGGAVLALSAVGLLAEHSSALFGAILLAFPLALQRWYRVLRGRRADGVAEGRGFGRVLGGDLLRMLPVLVVAVVLAAPMVFGAIGFTSGSYPYHPWGSHLPVYKALGLLATFHQVLPEPQLVLAALLAVGVLSFRALGRMRWLLLSGVALSVLFVLVACFGDTDLVITLSRPWWNDRYRLMALAAIPLCLFAAHGMAQLQRWLAKLVSRSTRPRAWAGPACAAVIVALFGVLTGGFSTAANAKTVSLLYYNGLPGEVVPPVNTDELAAMAELGRMGIPADEKVLNDRLDGTAWMYAIAGVHPVAAHYDAGVPPKDAAYLALHFREYDTDPEVRAAVRRLNVHHVLTGSGSIVVGGLPAPGLRDLDGLDFLRRDYANRGAAIYTIVR
ncbi:DUF6541 family protein [Amycolatopsis samaneae]|uniref:DUF6541 family protein n=1 Tax=Amycolatopsis samaneae TaxID=664691 RepID=A0ABW5GG44_9PSEU